MDTETLQRELDEARQTIAYLERRQSIDSLLRDADTIDLDAARLLTERVVSAMDEPDVAMAVEDLKRHKPYLFRQPPDPSAGLPQDFTGGGSGSGGGSGVMGPRVESDPALDAADQAMRTGSRRDLLAYLRLRRRG